MYIHNTTQSTYYSSATMIQQARLWRAESRTPLAAEWEPSPAKKANACHTGSTERNAHGQPAHAFSRACYQAAVTSSEPMSFRISGISDPTYDVSKDWLYIEGVWKTSCAPAGISRARKLRNLAKSSRPCCHFRRECHAGAARSTRRSQVRQVGRKKTV